jgi:precorrin-3B C17-methyltransferase
MSGRLAILGLGPGDPALQTGQVVQALEEATDLVGYDSYLARIATREGQRRHGSDNREELSRATLALGLAAEGKRVAVLSSGDPGVFAMASAVFEVLENGPSAWRGLEIEVMPGISAIFAAAARLGAPLGHDFCAISLSDNLKPWPVVLSRLAAAAAAGFVIALYNAASRARPWQLGAALDSLRPILPPRTPVIFATAISRPDEAIVIATLESADPGHADMRTLVLIGSAATRLIERPGAPPFVYTPRSAQAAS